MKRLEPQRGIIVGQAALAPPYFVTDLEVPVRAPVSPGQFVMLREPQALDPLLGRPFSIFAATEARDRGTRLSILYNVVGRGTARLAASRVGDAWCVLGPLGHGFDLARLPGQALLVAGGIGIAALPLLARALVERGVRVRLLYGARSARDLVGLDAFRDPGLDIRLATDDGSRGERGLVTALLERELGRADLAPDTAVYACGPSPMLRRLRELVLARSLTCQLALEARMACGFGVCLGCAIPAADEPGRYRLVCTDGPCMDAREVLP